MFYPRRLSYVLFYMFYICFLLHVSLHVLSYAFYVCFILYAFLMLYPACFCIFLFYMFIVCFLLHVFLVHGFRINSSTSLQQTMYLLICDIAYVNVMFYEWNSVHVCMCVCVWENECVRVCVSAWVEIMSGLCVRTIKCNVRRVWISLYSSVRDWWTGVCIFHEFLTHLHLWSTIAITLDVKCFKQITKERRCLLPPSTFISSHV